MRAAPRHVVYILAKNARGECEPKTNEMQHVEFIICQIWRLQ